MPVLVNELSVWDICFRWAGYDPRKFYFQIPLEVENNFRNLTEAILSASLACETITLEKRKFSKNEIKDSIYYWIDDIYACMHGVSFNRKLFRWAIIRRFDFMEWCNRMNAPLPNFWFPQGWNFQYELPEYELYPGHSYRLMSWSEEDRNEYFETNAKISELDKPSKADLKSRPNQEARIACQFIAREVWNKEPTRTIASVAKDPLVQDYGRARSYADATVREWVKVVAPKEVSAKRGRPRKNKE